MRKRFSLFRSLTRSRRRRSLPKQRTHGFESLESRTLLTVVPFGGEVLINETVIRDQFTVEDSSAVAIGSDQSSVVVFDGHGRGDHEGIFVSRYDRDGQQLNDATLVNTTTRGSQDSPSVAADADGDFVVAWSGRGLGDRHGVFVRRFSADGLPSDDAEILVNTTVGGDQYSPSLSVAPDGSFVVAWNGVGNGDADGVFIRRFGADGTPLADEALVNTTTDGEQTYAAVDVNASGEFVVSWSSRHQDGDSWGVFGQAFTADGAAQGAELNLNSTTDSSQHRPSVGINNDGSFIATWTQFDATNSQWQVMAKQFDGAGTSTLDEFEINPSDDAHQTDAKVAVGGGQFAVAWSRGPSDGSGYEVFAQLYNNDGIVDGDELTINAITAGPNSGHQRYPSIAMDGTSETMIVWSGAGSTDHQGVFGRRFESEGPQFNVGPDLDPIADTEAIRNVEVTIPVTATDENSSDVLTFILDADDSPAGATIEKTGSRSALIRWTPSAADALGTVDFRVIVLDDADPALSDAEDFTVTLVLDPPVLDLNGPDQSGSSFAAAITPDNTSVSITGSGLSIQDRDDDNLQRGLVRIVNQLDGDDEILTANTVGTNIVDLYDEDTGELTLIGDDTVQNYEQVLRSITYENQSINPDITDRVIEFVVDDGDNESAPATSTVSFEEPDLVAFAQALSASETTFFGAAWCGHCTEQKELFEDGQIYLPFVEVTNPDRTPNQIGIEEEIFTYPTWEFPDGSREEGRLTLAEFSDRSGVSIPTGSGPSLAPLSDEVLLVGSPLHVALDGYDPNGGELTYTVTSDNPQVAATVLQGNRSFLVETDVFGNMVFELFENRVPRATERFNDLSEIEYFEDLTFHRVANNFVIQAGDPSGPSELGSFDDQFDVDLQHNRTGLLSMAKNVDDSNDAEFFVTEGPSRHLDFNHSIFGLLVEGESNRAAISDTAVVGTSPTIPVTIDGTDIFPDHENAVVMLKAQAGASGSANITVTVSDEQGHSLAQTFNVDFQDDLFNGGPFLTDIPTIQTTVNTAAVFQLTAIDVENHAVEFSGDPLSNVDSLNVDPTTGVVTVVPPAGFTGTMQIMVHVGPTTTSNTQDPLDSQLVRINVS